ncbi:trafficking kinesin-binding protein 1-like isoform X3 [Physella acuta]|uniref:trafficking kinesin-binding protein 1-like isoform X3 n=1 Tax=Physella acuta TaxID=109671 RepID=UPI0027DCC9E3|nr:trafficking kinesin-binding protein 1-like isoform X3 [Physella acuta]XP_059177191.1 trafficking kinesin-binding protein 1-like isoform X3 [Physella acuta]
MDTFTVLCAERVSQMTKTYNDIEAVTRLLEEKERDLELAARIGQTLLSKNKELSSRSETLEEQLTLANERVNQLRHDLSMKDELLRFYNEDLEYNHPGEVTPNEKPPHDGINVDFLKKKVETLEDENLNLRLESAQLKSTTDSYEEKEKKLVEDCIQQLAEVNHQVESLAEELHEKCEECLHQKEEITIFLGQIAELQTKIRKLTLDNMDLHEKLTASTESQRRLTKELGSMQDKYDELLEMMEEATDELRILRGRHKVRANGQHHHSAYAIPTDSLASELETSLQQELSQSNRRAQSWKVFETARAAKRAATKAAQREVMSSTRMSVMALPSQSGNTSQNQSTYPSDVESIASDGYSADMDSLYGSNPELGRPGIPGSNDLESALKRLALRKANELNERDFHEEEERKRKQELEREISGTTSPQSVRSHYQDGVRSPGIMSWNSGPPTFKISDKLQIVKPLEGSMTLRHWQHLATPHLGGIFEEREGVQMRGEKKLELVEEVYSLSDLEEDDDPSDVHTRKEQDSSLIYTFTDSTVRNPGPYMGLGTLASLSSSPSQSTLEDPPIQASTPRADTTQSTYSMTLGLAALLGGRETAVERALSRVSALSGHPPTRPATDTPPTPGLDLNQRVLSSRSLGSLSSSSNSPQPKNLPGSRSLDKVLMEREDGSLSSFADPSQKPSLFVPGMTGQGFLQQLKNKGYSLYGLWGGKGPTESSTDGAEGPTKATAESVLPNGAGVGVLGALTNFRRSGIL